MPKTSPSAGKKARSRSSTASWKGTLVHHQLLLLVLGLLTVIAVGARVLRADILGPTPSGTGGSSSSEEYTSVRACDPNDNIFSDDTKPAQTKQRFESLVNGAVKERLDLIGKSPDKDSCTAEDDDVSLPMPVLRSLASQLPGWNESYFDTSTGKRERIARPVTFASFSSVLFELQREYECKLSDYERFTLLVVMSGSGAQQEGKPLSDLSQYAYHSHVNRIISSQQEKVVSRQALSRTIEALRGYELSRPIVSKLDCLQRRYLDLRNEVTLLADAVSCLPRIWDAATSLHDRAKDSPLNPSSSSSSAP